MPTANEIIQADLKAHAETIARLDALIPAIEHMAELVKSSLNQGGKVLWCGNGGSAADCQHLAAEFICRFQTERRSLPSIALTTDTSALTAISNDYGYERVFSRQVEGLCRPEDVLVGISTSGNSASILHAIEAAKAKGAKTVGWTGEGGGKLAALCDLTIAVPSPVTARIQEAHILIGHILCNIIDHAYTAD